MIRDGRLTAEPPDPGADATVQLDPATLNMMLFGCVSKVRAIATRKFVIGGPSMACRFHLHPTRLAGLGGGSRVATCLSGTERQPEFDRRAHAGS